MRSLAVDGYNAAEVAAALTASGREVSFRYEVLAAGEYVGDLDGVLGCTVENNALADVKRTAKIRVRDLGGIDYTADRIRPVYRLRMPDEVVQVTRDAGPKPYDEVVLADGPVGYWRLGEASGTQAVDSSGNGHDGTYVGSPTLGEPGAIVADSDTAVAFAGGNNPASYVDIGANPRTTPGSGSVECWVETSNWSTGDRWIYADRTPWTNEANSVGIFRWGSGVFYARVVSPAGTLYDLVFTWTDYFASSGWHHVVFTWDGPALRLYINGALVRSRDDAVSPSALSTTSFVGGGPGRPTGHAMDEFALYDRALTAAEVAEHYDAGRARIRTYETVNVTQRRYAEWPLGVFVLSSPDRRYDGTSTVRDVECYDLGVVLLEDRVLDRYVVTAGTAYTTAVETLLTAAGLTDYYVTASAATLPADRDWPPGTPRSVIVNDLLRAINYGTLWWDADGYAIARPYQSPTERPTGHTYATDARSLIVPEIDVGFDLFDVPNVWVATVSEPDRTPLRSVYTNDNPTSPTSTVARGRSIVDHRKVDAADQAALDAYVARLAFEASQVLEVVEFTTGTMPHHEDADVLEVVYPGAGLAARYTEHRWSLECKAGGSMKHRVRRVVSV